MGLCAGVLAFLVMRAVTAFYADEVLDCGDHFVIRKGRDEGTVHLRDIEEIGYSVFQPAHVWFQMQEHPVFGRRVAFLPNVSFIEYTAFVKSLRKRMSENSANKR